MSNNTVKGAKRLTTSNTMANAVRFMVEQALHEIISTAEVVRIGAADQNGTSGPGGYAEATPLVCPVDNWKNTLSPATLAKLPYFRPQAGKAAIIMDPQPGDKAIMVSLKRDSSAVATGKDDPVQPGSHRTFDQADSYLINGFLGVPPEIWLKLDPVSGDIELSTKSANVEISCREAGDMVIKTKSGNITIQAGNGGEGDITLDGRVIMTRTAHILNKYNEEGGSQFKGGFTNTGGVVRSNNVTLETHLHKGVQTGGSNTGTPNTGT